MLLDRGMNRPLVFINDDVEEDDENGLGVLRWLLYGELLLALDDIYFTTPFLASDYQNEKVEEFGSELETEGEMEERESGREEEFVRNFTCWCVSMTKEGSAFLCFVFLFEKLKENEIKLMEGLKFEGVVDGVKEKWLQTREKEREDDQ